jgi:hypothetical protein
MTVLEIVKAKTKKLTDLQSIDYDIAIDEVEQKIKSYINRDEVPEELNFTWANMSVDLLKYSYYSNLTPEKLTSDPDIDPALISSLKIGDLSIQLGSVSSLDDRVKALKAHRISLDDLIMNYKDDLNKYRRMVW